MFVVVTSLTPVVYRRPRLKPGALSGAIWAVGWRWSDVLELLTRTLVSARPRMTSGRIASCVLVCRSSMLRMLLCVTLGGAISSGRIQQYRDYARSHGGFYGKYLRKGDWFIALRVVVHHLRALRRWVRGAVTGDQEAARIGRAYLTGLLPGIVVGLRRGERL